MKTFEMTQKQYEEIMEASKPVPMIMLQCGTPRSPQENANAAWNKLGQELGFDYMTARPSDRGDRFFSAEPIEEEE